MVSSYRSQFPAQFLARLVVAGWLSVVAVPALAYVLPAGPVLRRTVDHRDDLRLAQWRVEGALTFFGALATEAFAAGVTNAQGQVDGIWSVKPPGRCRLDLGTPGAPTLATVQSRGKVRQEGPALAPVSVLLEHVCALFAIRAAGAGEGTAALERHLRGLQIDVTETSLGRLGRQVAYVIGSNQASSAQFWVFKDSFLPARLKFSDASGTAWDIQFIDYANPSAGQAFPRRVEVLRGGELSIRFATKSADLRAALSDKIFGP
ncbi:MAG: hypothetical protein ACKVPX_15770 [Myxococcaceae bacterium]